MDPKSLKAIDGLTCLLGLQQCPNVSMTHRATVRPVYMPKHLTVLYRHRREIISYNCRVLLITVRRTAAESASSENDGVEAAEMMRPSLRDFCGSSDSAQNINKTAILLTVY